MRDRPIESAMSLSEDPTFGALAWAAASIARLDQALAGHVLAPALLYRARLEAVRRHAAVDGHGINPWHLAAMLEGLRPRMDLNLTCLTAAPFSKPPATPAANTGGWCCRTTSMKSGSKPPRPS